MSDREKLIDILESQPYGSFSYEEMADYLIANGVTVQKHGEWVVLDECSNAGAYCSVCHKKVYKECYGNCKMKSTYCPNCGAKMEVCKNENKAK